MISALEACGINSWQKVPLPQLQRQSGSRAHLEGWYSPQAATVQPGKLVRGLRRVALAMGIRLHEQTPMIRLQEDSPPVVHTPRGKVKARKVVIAINAWMARTFPEFERSVAIVSSDMVITEPAPQSLDACGLDGGISVLDSRIFVHYYRSTADGRLMLGKGGNTFAYGGRMLPVFDQPSPLRPMTGAAADAVHSRIDRRAHRGQLERRFRSLGDRPAILRLPARASGYVLRLRLLGQWRGSKPHGRRTARIARAGAGQRVDAQSPVRRAARQFPPEPIRYFGSLMVRNAIRRKEAAEDRGGKPLSFDVGLSRFAAAAGKADKGSGS